MYEPKKRSPASQKRRRKKRRAQRQRKRERQQKVAHLSYWEYIASDHWKKLRSDIIAERGSCCEECGVHSYAVHLHHKTYRRLRREKRGDLELLCGNCHSMRHEEKWIRDDPLFREFNAIVNGL